MLHVGVVRPEYLCLPGDGCCERSERLRNPKFDESACGVGRGADSV